MMDNKMLDAWLKKYEALDQQANRYWKKMREYEQAGKETLAKRAAERIVEIDSTQDGMLEALQIFGYTAIYEKGICKVIEFRHD